MVLGHTLLGERARADAIERCRVKTLHELTKPAGQLVRYAAREEIRSAALDGHRRCRLEDVLELLELRGDTRRAALERIVVCFDRLESQARFREQREDFALFSVNELGSQLDRLLPAWDALGA